MVVPTISHKVYTNHAHTKPSPTTNVSARYCRGRYSLKVKSNSEEVISRYVVINYMLIT